MTYRSDQGLVSSLSLPTPKGRRAEVAFKHVQGALVVDQLAYVYKPSVAWDVGEGQT